MDAVVAQNVTKIIKGRTVLSNISFSLEPGKAYGFYGSNGSGKSMLFRAISGLIHPTSGNVFVFGKQIGKEQHFPENMGMVIESVGFWPYYTGFENLKVLASIRHLISDDEIKTAIKRVGLDPADKRKYSKYSLGMKQRLGIAQAIMEKPSLLILDEPTNALDEDGVKLIRDVISEEIDRGATVLVASHIKEDLSICSRCFKMHEGKLTESTEGK